MAVLDEVDAVLRSLRGVWDEEVVDQLDHALQAAARARDDGADDELLLAAALHDLAYSPLFGEIAGEQHDRIAMEWLAPRFGDRVGWLAGAHVAAKRYLVATEPGYAGILSDASVDSLRHQGGAHVDPDLVAHRWWFDAVRLRRYDDGAKVVDGDAVSIDDVLTVAKRILDQRLP
ncbi:HD family phosphohydrolase [Mycobacterium sp. NPDC048908]|uniref:HD family phosphohydrolase n=1 Tax=Mycobacterium sp. NPDC048908 TaxID=3364292 RepID=UPI003711ACF8